MNDTQRHLMSIAIETLQEALEADADASLLDQVTDMLHERRRHWKQIRSHSTRADSMAASMREVEIETVLKIVENIRKPVEDEVL